MNEKSPLEPSALVEAQLPTPAPSATPPAAPELGPSIQVLAQAPDQNRLQWLTSLRADQFRRWQRGERVRAEVYRDRLPLLQSDQEALIDLIYSEFLLREESGENPQVDEYLRRFPELEGPLKSQLEMHQALGVEGGLFSVGGRSQHSADLPPTNIVRPPEVPGEVPTITGPAAKPPPRAAKPLPQVKGYEILGELGRGGMGVVYKARHEKLKRLVALKMILGGAHVTREKLARFHSEAEAVARLKHPNIVQIYEVGDFEDRPYFSLEFVDGGSLDRKLKGTPQPPREAAALVETLARAMHAAHEVGIVHRDLKPANILLQAHGSQPVGVATPKITDFGLAKQLDDETGQTRTGAIMGTPSYMAPEQALGLTKQIGPVSDVYALAAILYEVLTGRPPFKGSTVWETLDQVRQQEPVAPSRLQPRIPRDLETICLKGLHKEIPRRYASAGDLADDLHRFLAGEPIHARPSTAMERSMKWAKRRPAVAAALGLALVCILGASAYGAQHLNRRMQVQNSRITVQDDMYSGQGELAAEQQKPIEQRQWDKTQSFLDRAQAIVESEPALADLKEKIDSLREQLRIERHRQQRFDNSQAWYRDKFLKPVHQAILFQQTQFLNRETMVRDMRRLAPEALVPFAVTLANKGAPGPAPAEFADYLSADQRASIVPGCYDLMFAWAEATAATLANEDRATQAEQAIKILERAASLGKPTRALHKCLSRYLARKGDGAGAQREEEQADQTPPRTVLDFYLAGMEGLNRGNIVEAIPNLEKALRLQPGHFGASYGLAECQLRINRFDAAKANLTACLRQQPDFLWPYLLRGYAHTMLKEFNAAAEDFAAAEKLNPDDAVRYGILVNRGFLFLRQREAKFEEAARLRTDDQKANATAAEEDGQQRLDEAVRSFQEAVRLKPDQHQAYLNLAEVHLRRSELAEALKQYDKAVELQPSAALYRSRARLHLLRKDYAAALPDLEQAVAREPRGLRSPNLAEDHAERGRILFRNRQFAEALKAFEEAQQAHPDEYPLSHRLRAETLLELNRHQEAVQALDRHLANTPEPVPDVYRARGLARAKLGNYPGAVEDYTSALELDRKHNKPANTQTLSYRGWAYLICEAPKLALRDFEEVLKRDSDNADAYNGRGSARVQVGNFKGAVSDAESALRIGPPSPRLIYNAARIYSQAADRLDDPSGRDRQAYDLRLRYEDRALRLLRQALELLPPQQRNAFWKDYVQLDPAMKALRRTSAFAQMTAEHAPPKK